MIRLVPFLLCVAFLVSIGSSAVAEDYKLTCTDSSCEWTRGVAPAHTYTWYILCHTNNVTFLPEALTCEKDKVASTEPCRYGTDVNYDGGVYGYCSCLNEDVWANNITMHVTCNENDAKKQSEKAKK